MDALLTIGYLLLFVFAVLFFVVMHRAFWVRFYRMETAEDEIHRLVCDDGWETRLYRYRGRADGAFAANPVIISHGYCANRFNVDFHPRASLARYLNRLGFDTWVIELRGCADATRTPPRGRRRGEVLFEDFVDLDMPAAIRHVLEHTGADGVHWVGHSMGGMIALAFAQGPGQSLLKSITAIGSPARLQLTPFAHFLCTLSWALGWLRELPLSVPSQILAPFYFRLPLDPVAIRQVNLAPDTVRRAMVNLISDMPMALTRQLARMQTSGGDVVAAEDERNFTAGLSRIQVPLLCVAGADDNVAPPRSARLAVERASSERKAWIVLGGDGSDSPTYGHGDLLIGEDAYQHVFPHVAAWVADIAGVPLDHDAVEAVSRADLELERQPVVSVPWVPPPPSAVRSKIPAPPSLWQQSAVVEEAEEEEEMVAGEGLAAYLAMAHDTGGGPRAGWEEGDADGALEDLFVEAVEDRAADVAEAAAIATTAGEMADETAAATAGDVADETAAATAGDVADETAAATAGDVADETAATTAEDAADETAATTAEDAADDAAADTAADGADGTATDTADGATAVAAAGATPDADEPREEDDGEGALPAASAPGKIDNQAQRLAVAGERRTAADRREGATPVSEERRAVDRRRGLRRTPPPGWETTRTDQTRRVRPERLHRSPVSGDALAEALRLAASRADRVLATQTVSATVPGSEDDP